MIPLELRQYIPIESLVTFLALALCSVFVHFVQEGEASVPACCIVAESAEQKEEGDYAANFFDGKFGSEDKISVVVDIQSYYATYWITANVREVKPLIGEAEFKLKLPKDGQFKGISMKEMEAMHIGTQQGDTIKINAYAAEPRTETICLRMKVIAPLPQGEFSAEDIELPKITDCNFTVGKLKSEHWVAKSF